VAAGAERTGRDRDDIAVMKRDDELDQIVWVADDDGDDTGNTGNTGAAGTDNTDNDTASTGEKSAESNDNTGSGYSRVSRDRDRSRGDRTKDRTRDGGDPTRDRSRHKTNDNSRNDTRG
jgi:hypothetical protein